VVKTYSKGVEMLYERSREQTTIKRQKRVIKGVMRSGETKESDRKG
jgi:hypothetical protein